MAGDDKRALIAVRDRREAAIQTLSDGFAADLLTIEEFDERLARAHAATTAAELEALVADLPAAAKSTALAPLAVDPSLVPTKKRISSVFGNVERHGPWIVPDRIAARSVFGNAVLDFREARFTTETTELEVNVVFGNLEIIVPPHLAVDCEGSTIFGNIESHAGAAAVSDPGRPLLRIHGRVIFGNVEVQTRLPGESEGEARKRRRKERKELVAAERARRALPPATK